MATIKDIAKAAGVAQGTVSNVLNGRGNVSSEKIRHVLTVSEKLGYIPNERAKLLRKGHTNVLGVLLPKQGSARLVANVVTVVLGSLVLAAAANLKVPLPPPETLIFTTLLASMYFSAAAWAMGRTVVDPFMTSSAPKAAPDRAARATRVKIAASFFMFKNLPVICFLIFLRGTPGG